MPAPDGTGISGSTKPLPVRQGPLTRRPGAPADSTTMDPRRCSLHQPRARRAYRPCLLSWVEGEPTTAVIGRMRRAALDHDPGGVLVSGELHSQMLLFAEDSLGEPIRERLRRAVQSVIDAAHAVQPSAEIRAVVGDRVTSPERLPVVAARLRRLARYALDRSSDEVVWARGHSLLRMLQSLDAREASAFVDGQLAPLQTYDREHRTNLQRVLELALDHSNRGTAARAAFMHRNTFRRQLRKALELIDVDLASPEERLALHIALKMRALAPPPRSERFRRQRPQTWRHSTSSRAAP